MANKQGELNRIDIQHFEGVNSLVAHNLAKKEELSEAINCRSLQIGTVEKRKGFARLGNALSSTYEYGLFFYSEDSFDTSDNLYRISRVGATTSIYYLNTSAVWTAMTGNGTGLYTGNPSSSNNYSSNTNAEDCMFVVNGSDANRYIKAELAADGGTRVYTSADIGDSTTQFDITKVSNNVTYTYDSTGTDPKISENIAVGDVVHCMGQNFVAGNNGAFIVDTVTTNAFTVENAGGVVESNKTLGTGALRINNHLTNSPVAYHINYYKDRLYLGDYTDTTKYKTGILRSSVPLGIVGLVDGDHDATTTALKVTDIKHIYADDVLDIYRGNSKIGTIIVTAKNTATDTLTIDSFATDIKSADELWVGGTYTGKRIFRWPENPESGIDVKQYDTFKISGGNNDALTMVENVGDVMVISNKKNLAIWNDYSLQNFDLGIGCVSNRGYIKHLGVLFFIDYTGIYMTTGDRPKLISAKVEKYFTEATPAGLRASAMGKEGYSVFAAIDGNITLKNPDGSSISPALTSTTLEYNLRQENWYPHINVNAHQFATYEKSGNSDRLEFVGTSGDVYELLRDVDDDGNEIPFRITTNNITLGGNSFEKICYPKQIILETERGSDIKCFVSLDNLAFYELKRAAVKGSTIFDVTKNAKGEEARARKIRISIRETSKRLCKVSRLSILYSLTNEEEKQDK